MTEASPLQGTPVAKQARKRRPAEVSPETLVARMQAHGGVSARAVTQARPALEEARDDGLLATGTEHISLRVPKGLPEAAKSRAAKSRPVLRHHQRGRCFLKKGMIGRR